jgi:hypothetical protein
VTRAIAINPTAASPQGTRRLLLTRMTAARAAALDDEALFMAMYALYRIIRQSKPGDPQWDKLIAAWELMDAQTLERGRDRLPRLRLH